MRNSELNEENSVKKTLFSAIYLCILKILARMGARIRGDFTTTIFIIYSLYIREINCACADYDK